MKWLIRVGLVAFISANSKIFFRAIISTLIIFVCYLFSKRYEALLLATNSDKVFIPLYIFTAITGLIILWNLVLLKWFSSFAESKKIDEAKKSFENKPQSFGDFADIEKHPSLKTKADTILNK
jgi:H+/Cl- antiporter ClcA